MCEYHDCDDCDRVPIQELKILVAEYNEDMMIDNELGRFDAADRYGQVVNDLQRLIDEYK